MDISIEEVVFATTRTKNGKSSGYDNIANEILKLPEIVPVLHTLYAYCFRFGKTPDDWFKSLITPIYKEGKPKNEPLSHRGISLMSTVAKVFTSILNNRISAYLETNNLLCDEQNGFRKNRSCLDHIFTLTTIIKNRQHEKLPTYACFVDFAKAFDSVNHELLWNTILQFDIKGKMYNVIKFMYSNMQAAVTLNGHLTNWFNINGGVRQGDNLAPTLFAMYINSLAKVIKEENCGIDIGNNIKISILLYADDIVLLSDTPEGLQRELDVLNTWIKKYRMAVNMEKTKIIHFRKSNKERTTYPFKLGNDNVNITENYKYLGLTLNEYRNYKETSHILAKSASRALGALTAKYINARGLLFSTFTKLYNSTVLPVLHYACPIWGAKIYNHCDNIHHRAMRTFLGAGKKSPIPALYGEMGWSRPETHRQKETIRYWLQLYNTDNNRILKQVFIWDYIRALQGKKSWNKDIKDTLEDHNMSDLFYGLNVENKKESLVQFEKQQLEIESKKLMEDMSNMPKLRTYRKLKMNPGTENYVKLNISRQQRSTMAKFRNGTFPINIETGRHKQQPLEERVCHHCNILEDEMHYLLHCPLYSRNRRDLYQQFEDILNINPQDLEDAEIFFLLLNITKMVKPTTTFIQEAYEVRKNSLQIKQR